MGRALGLENLALRQMDVMQITAEFGEFDYMIAHGLYSWVPGPVREQILRVCKANLAPNGVAYVSYNAYPGGHVRQMVREMMLQHVARFPDPREKVEQAKALLKFLADAREENDPWGRVLRWELERVGPRDPGALYHDDLAEVNEPFYFRDFAARAAEHGLQFLSEADFADTQYASADAAATGGGGAGGAARAMRAVTQGLPPGDVIGREQYADFVRGRKFRQTLLCHADVRLQRPPAPGRVKTLYVAGQVRPVSPNPAVRSSAPEQFATAKGPTATTNQPVIKAALLELSERWPKPVHFDELLGRARERAGLSTAGGPGEDDARAALSSLLLGGFGGGLLELFSYVPRFVTEPGERPTASALARLEAGSGEVVTNLLSARVRIEDPLARGLFGLLDGTRGRDALVRDLTEFVARGGASVERDGRRVTDVGEVASLIRGALDDRLRALARLALLIA